MRAICQTYLIQEGSEAVNIILPAVRVIRQGKETKLIGLQVQSI